MLLVAVTLAGCARPPTSAIKPKVVDTSLQSFRPIPMDDRDTCATQREIAGHNSGDDTLKTGKQHAYCAPCDCPKVYEQELKARKKAARRTS